MPKTVDPKEFVDFGYLHELNRQFLHPLGLALYVVEEEDGTIKLGGILDYRDDPEGMIFAEDVLDPAKAARVAAEATARRDARVQGIGFWVQPITETPDGDPSS